MANYYLLSECDYSIIIQEMRYLALGPIGIMGGEVANQIVRRASSLLVLQNSLTNSLARFSSLKRT